MNVPVTKKVDKTLKLSIPYGHHVFVEMSTMLGTNVKMTLRDAKTKKVSFVGERCSEALLPALRGFYRCDYTDTELQLQFGEALELDLKIEENDLYGEDNKLAVRTVTVVGGDLATAEYNDFMLHLTSMRCTCENVN